MSARQPRVSVIMPVINEERHLRHAVDGILAQDYGGELEVVISVGPSKDRTRELEDTPSIRGMVHAVRHMVKIIEERG